MNFDVKSPETTAELLDTIAEYQDKPVRFGAGYTDLTLELKQQVPDNLTLINLANLSDDDFTTIAKHEDKIRIGSLTTARHILDSDLIESAYPTLHQSARELASRQIRQVATVGGNICTASPAGDLVCALVALKAECDILHGDGTSRKIPLTAFQKGVREIDLADDEVLRSVYIPQNDGNQNVHSGFIKVGVRKSMEIALVSLAYHILTTNENIITHAGIAIGSVAPTVMFTSSACEILVGRNLAKIDRETAAEFAKIVIEYASPISDIRASAWYRKKVLHNICVSIFEK